MVAYTKPQQRKRKKRMAKGERDQIKFIDLRFERGQVVGFGKARRRQISVDFGPIFLYVLR